MTFTKFLVITTLVIIVGLIVGMGTGALIVDIVL